jgi:hypothetical protein
MSYVIMLDNLVFRDIDDLCYYAGQLKNHLFRHIHDLCYCAGQLKILCLETFMTYVIMPDN